MHLNIILLINMGLVAGDMEPYIIEGDYIDIRRYPHSTLQLIKCKETYICGGSFITDRVVLTAGHCINLCVHPEKDRLVLKYGHASIKHMKSTKIYKTLLHEGYDDDTLENDIGLMYSDQAINFGNTVKRVAVLGRFPQLATHGYVTGWGLTRTDPYEMASSLKYVHQYILNRKDCTSDDLPPGVFCGYSKQEGAFPEMGDSGGAFVVYKYIQIGIVSYMLPKSTTVGYTNTTYHYKWIRKHTLGLLCRLY